MLSLQAIALLVPILGGDVVVGADRPKIFYEGISKVREGTKCLL